MTKPATLTMKRRRFTKGSEEEAEMFVIGRAQFYSRQYLIPLILLTAVSAIGWYYTFLAGTLTNVYEFVKQGGSTSMLNDLLTHNVTPFTAAFLGGWIFIIVMLFNNWTCDDLYPRSFFYAAAHLMIAMIVGFVFATVLSQGSSPWIVIPATAAALLISIVPYDSIGLFTQRWIKSLEQNIDPKPKEGNDSAWISHELRTVPECRYGTKPGFTKKGLTRWST